MVPFIKYATFGIVPYKGPDVPRSMADTSLKLMQYVLFEVPAVRPVEVVGNYLHRIGYKMGDAESISAAIKTAFRTWHAPDLVRPLNWQQVTRSVC